MNRIIGEIKMSYVRNLTIIQLIRLFALFGIFLKLIINADAGSGDDYGYD